MKFLKNQGRISSIRKDSIAGPSISRITEANFPQTIHAGKPIIKIDSSKGGAPFFTNYSTEQGLAQGVVNCSLTDKAGNLWFGTGGGGVSKYDGKSFTNYTTAQGLASNAVYSIRQDSKGNLWFGTDGGLSKYDGFRFKNYTTALGLPSNDIRSIMLDRNGNLWACTNGAGVSKYNGNSFKNYTTAQGLAGNVVGSMCQDKARNLWFGTYENGVSKYDGKSFTNYTTAQGLASNTVWNIIEDKTGNLWFGTNEGISKYDGKSFTKYTTSQGLANNIVWSITQDNKENLWLGTNKGVSKYDGNSFTNYTTTQGLANNEVWSIIVDKTGNLWFGTNGGGVSKYGGNSYTNYNSNQGLAGNLVFRILQDKAGNLWFGTNGNGVSKYDGKSFTNYNTSHGLTHNTVWSINSDKTGNLWFGTQGGVSKFDGESFTNYTPDQGLAGYNVMSIIQDKAGNLWLGTYENGLSKYDGNSFTNYTIAQGLPSNRIESIIQDNKENLWLGTDEGVSKFDGNSFTNYTIAHGLADNHVSCMIQDKAGNLWFGTNGGGVSKYDGNRFTNYTTAQGLADNMIYGIAEDSIRNIIWFGTNLGLSGLRQNTTGNGSGQGDVFENFNNSTGYPIKDVNANALCLDSKGILWAGCGDNKLIRFDYGSLNKNMEPLSLQIQNVKVNYENICWNTLLRKKHPNETEDSLAMLNEMVTTFGKVLLPAVLDSMSKKYDDIQFDGITRFYPVPVNLVLPYEDNNVSFDFAAIEPALPKQIKYQYKLEGYDKDWTPLSNKTSADFGGIREGDYTFKLKALSPFGAWSETEYKFKVLPPWQRTWWAYSLYIVVFLIALQSFIKWRTKALKKEKVLLEEKVAIRTNELQEEKEKVESTLQELKSSQAQLIQREKMASLGELTAGIAHEIQNPLNFVNNFSEVNKELIEELRQEKNKANNGKIEDEILADIEQNLEKVIHHGKRADAIVKGMLQHSRSSSITKEPTDINALADEYLRLSYHGLRAKDKSFNVTIQTDFDESIGKINIIPQDLGRVLLNLYNNAFYSVSEKKKNSPLTPEGGTENTQPEYEPAVTVSTTLNPPSGSTGAWVEIRVKDNGMGISPKVLDKIFQPFFTTKPAGQGTGLGLSLAYDIVTKEHGGQLKVETKQGDGAEFILELPGEIKSH